MDIVGGIFCKKKKWRGCTSSNQKQGDTVDGLSSRANSAEKNSSNLHLRQIRSCQPFFGVWFSWWV